MNANHKTEKLLRNLQDAIDEALAESPAVLAAMGELEDAGYCPSFSVQVSIPPEEIGPPEVELISFSEELALTRSDESFLRALGIADCSTE